MNEYMTPKECTAIDIAVAETFGSDTPVECYEIGREMFADAIQHQHHVRYVEGFKRPLDRQAALADAVESIRACAVAV